MKNNISIIGAGNVAHSIVPALLNAGYKVDYILSKSGKSARLLAEKYNLNYSQNFKDLTSHIIIVCTNDSEISTISQEIDLTKEQIIVHTAGSISLEVLSQNHKNSGIVYPLQTFSKGRIVDLKEIPICIEASNERTLITIEELSRKLSNNVSYIDSNQRLQLHVAAVFVCNFTNLMYTTGSDLLKEKDIDFQLLHPLIAETAKKAIENNPDKVQTGPAKRNDKKTIETHQKTLSNQYLEMYELLTKWIKNRFSDKDKA